MAPMNITSEAEFSKYISSSKLTVVDFTATWCGPCKAVAPRFDALSTKHTNCNFLKVDVDQMKSIASTYGVRAMPTFMLFKSNSKLAEVVGADIGKVEQLVNTHSSGSSGGFPSSGGHTLSGAPTANRGLGIPSSIAVPNILANLTPMQQQYVFLGGMLIRMEPGLSILRSTGSAAAVLGFAGTDLFALPLRFDSTVVELDVLGVGCALVLGSSFRSQIHAAIDRGVFDTIRFGLMALFISDANLSALRLKEFSLGDVASLFEIPISREVKHESLSFVTVSEHHPLREFATLIKSVLNEIGDVLVAQKYPSFGAFIASVCKGGVDASILVDALSSAFPCFRDVASVDGNDVYFLTKAQRLANLVHRRFPALVKSSKGLNLASDPAVVANLISSGVIIVSEEISQKLKSNFDFGNAADNDTIQIESSLRAAGVAAIEAIFDESKKIDELREWKLTSLTLSLYFRSNAKGESNRIINKETLFF
ncbi:hypothetical protein HK100_001574 [Physocladia obscura]|uniref:Thioredoxin domain-containing protein n=1 Tax=Physocladia obscura TaxID=109957 RepID=A0AAD5SWL3_9FUNG|nr:hypothetical protein HK100_001574 [Physocladia obscura]